MSDLPTVRDLLLARAGGDGTALLHEDHRWSWREYVAASSDRAAALRARLRDDRPPHVGTLLGNTPEMAMALAAGALGGHVTVGVNTTRRGAALARDVRHADCQVLLVDQPHRHLLFDLDLGDTEVVDVSRDCWPDPPGPSGSGSPPPAVAPDDLFMLIFTSGTSGEPKAVTVTHDKVTGAGLMLADRFGLGGDDVCYVSMPLFHSNAVLAGWGVALAAGAATAVARFSASRLVDDLRRYGATYLDYVGKPLAYVLATAERPDDADNPLRVAFGNEAGDRDIAEFARRFACWVQDGFGSTENAVVVSRTPDAPPGSLGRPAEGVEVLDPETGRACPPGVVGELVNTTGAGAFTGYYQDPAADAERMRDGMYWSGDLATVDEAGFVFFVGRRGDWLRVGGENLGTAPIERVLLRHPAVSRAAVYAVPDPSSGDQVAAALVLHDDAGLDPRSLEVFLAEQPDLSAQAWPRFVRICDDLPTTATNKVLRRELTAQGVEHVDGPVWLRTERGTAYRRA